MKALLLLLFVGLFLYACEQPENVPCGMCGENLNRIDQPKTPEDAMIVKAVKDTSTTGDHDKEFLENKAKIEEKFGEQWDFCHCVVVNDSLDKAAKAGKMDDKFMDRFDEVDQHCKAFLVMDATKTPDERLAHEKKIKKCLRANGIR